MEKTNPVDPLYKIWPTFPASGLSEADDFRWKIHECTRAGGGYVITMDAVSLLNHPGVCPMSDSDRDQMRARLTTILVDRRQAGEEFPLVTIELVKEAISKPDLMFPDRAYRLLRFLADQEMSFGAGTRISLEGSRISDSDSAAMAWSESTTLEEVNLLLDHLVDKNWLVRAARISYQVTHDGNRHLADLAAG